MAVSKGNGSSNALIFTCAGAAHGGQVANEAGVRIGQEKGGKLFCMAAVAAEIPDKLDVARKAKSRIVIDGCGDRCCGKILHSNGLPVELHVVVTDIGVEKQPANPNLDGDARKVADHILTSLKGGNT